MKRNNHRGTFGNMKCVKLTGYYRELRRLEKTIYKYRHHFVDIEGKHYVYSGEKRLCRQGETISFDATVTTERDDYGFCRLSRPTGVRRAARETLI